MHARFRILGCLLVVIAIILGIAGCRNSQGAAPKADKPQSGAAGQRGQGGPGGRGGMAGLPVPVVATPVVTQDFPIYLNGLGNVAAYNTVTVKTRVDGELVKVNFREGQDVKAGETIAQIDPRPFEVALHQAQGQLAKDEAQLADARANLERYKVLFSEKVIARQQVDTQASLVGQLEGTIQADRAQVENARLNLRYSTIKSPINGRVGLRNVDLGNIVHASDQNGLVVITQLQPIAVIFTLPEDYLQQVLKHSRNGSLPVDAYTRDDRTKIAGGKLLTMNNMIDPATGTNRLKAVFDNKNHELWPNQFVNIHLLLETKKNAIVVPTAGVQRGNQGTFAFVVKPDKTVEARPVKTGVTEGNLVSIESGLNPGDLVVTDGQDKLQPGSKVELRQARPGGSNSSAANSANPANPSAAGVAPAQGAAASQGSTDQSREGQAGAQGWQGGRGRGQNNGGAQAGSR